MKNPNGYGTIKKLSGNRRRPFVFMISANGKQKAMGYFATLLDAVDINDNARKMILGHARHDVTNGVYTHKTLRQLRKAIEKI